MTIKTWKIESLGAIAQDGKLSNVASQIAALMAPVIVRLPLPWANQA